MCVCSVLGARTFPYAVIVSLCGSLCVCMCVRDAIVSVCATGHSLTGLVLFHMRQV